MTSTSHSITSYVVAVTGGIGSGKTTVSNAFNQRYGVPVIDADIVAREVVEPGQPALDELVAVFGADILDSRGELDRRRLKRIVFDDPAQRKTLEAILHPLIRQRMRLHLQSVQSDYCLLGIPLLAEGGSNELVDRVLVVDCPEQLQIERVSKRDNLSARDVSLIMQSQASREQRLAIADDIILNDGDTAALEQKIEELHQLYTRLAHAAERAVK